MGILTLSIGDVHGNNGWKQLGDIKQLLANKSLRPKYDKYIFVGDYVDSYSEKDRDITSNFIDILKFKEAFPNHVVLLLGNHDLQYMFTNNSLFMCTGYRSKMYNQLHQLYNDNIDKFVAAYGYGTTIWTHAGVHATWYRKAGLPQYEGDAVKLAKKIQWMFDNDVSDLYDIGFIRGGMDNVGGPFWVDKSKLYRHPLEGYNQIVGHTHTHSIEIYTVDGKTISFIDALYDDDPVTNYMGNKMPTGLVRYVD